MLLTGLMANKMRLGHQTQNNRDKDAVVKSLEKLFQLRKSGQLRTLIARRGTFNRTMVI